MRGTLSKKTIGLAMALALASVGTWQARPVLAQNAVPAAGVEQPHTVAGQVTGVSKKAKTISVEEKGKTVLIRYNDGTTGMEHAQVGEGVIVTWASVGKDRLAVSIAPKLAKLPEGVSEITPAELVALLAGPDAKTIFLADARPASRFVEGTIPGSVSVPVDLLEEKKEGILPADKDIQLLFYCGGPT